MSVLRKHQNTIMEIFTFYEYIANKPANKKSIGKSNNSQIINKYKTGTTKRPQDIRKITS